MAEYSINSKHAKDYTKDLADAFHEVKEAGFTTCKEMDVANPALHAQFGMTLDAWLRNVVMRIGKNPSRIKEIAKGERITYDEARDDMVQEVSLHIIVNLNKILPKMDNIGYLFKTANNCVLSKFNEYLLRKKNIEPNPEPINPDSDKSTTTLIDILPDHGSSAELRAIFPELLKEYRDKLLDEISVLSTKPAEAMVWLYFVLNPDDVEPDMLLNRPHKPSTMADLLMEYGVRMTFAAILREVHTLYNIAPTAITDMLVGEPTGEPFKLDSGDNKTISQQISRLYNRAKDKIDPMKKGKRR